MSDVAKSGNEKTPQPGFQSANVSLPGSRQHAIPVTRCVAYTPHSFATDTEEDGVYEPISYCD